MGTRRSQCTWTSDEPRGSEEMLASQIASHVSGLEKVRVVASASFLKTLTDRLPFGTDVKPDFAAPLSARFNARVTVVTPASTATFELKRVGKVDTGPETVTLGNGQVWAKTNLRAVGGLTKATSDTDFGGLTREKKPAYFETPSGGILYNMHVNFGPLCHADFIVPTKVQLQALWDYYYDQPGSDMARDLEVKFDGKIYDSTYYGQQNREEWWASGWDAALLYKGGVPGERADTEVHTVQAGDILGFSVRLIRK